MGDIRADQIHDGPLDSTRLAADIARDFPGLNESVRHAEWRSAMKRRVREMRDGTRCPSCGDNGDCGETGFECGHEFHGDGRH